MFMLCPTVAHRCLPTGPGTLLRRPSPSAGQERHLPQCADTWFQTPFFPWACSFCPGAPEGPGVGFSIITKLLPGVF